MCLNSLPGQISMSNYLKLPFGNNQPNATKSIKMFLSPFSNIFNYKLPSLLVMMVTSAILKVSFLNAARILPKTSLSKHSNNTLIKNDQFNMRDNSRLPMQDKFSNYKYENAARLWHQSMNISRIGDDLTEMKTIASHPEPLKYDKDNKDGDYENDESGMAGTIRPPPCAGNGKHFKHYCSFKEAYPEDIVSKIVKYYKYPLESMFKDLQSQVMPTLAKDSDASLVCDSTTQLLRVGWAMNTNGRWVVVLNTDLYQQYVTEVICRYGDQSNCNFVPPCYRAKCVQRYNTQKLLVIDPHVPHKGPFLSEFLFPSCCVCRVDTTNHLFTGGDKRTKLNITNRS